MQWQGDCKRAADSNFTFDRYLAVVQVYKPFDNAQSQSGTGNLADILPSMKRLKQALLIF